MSTARALRIVLYEGAGSRPLDAPVRSAALRLLLESGYGVTRVSAGATQPTAPGDGPIAVLGRFEQAQPTVAEAQGDGRPVFFCNVEGLEADGMLRGLDELHGRANTAPRAKWKPWFPVIDFSRCTNCMQCLTFCLFDVYGVSKEKKIEVRNPTNCKTDCPACSRVCPEVAILFPKYKGGPINGDEVREDDLHREKMKVDISALLGGDIYAALRQRSTDAKARFSKERDEKRALDERKRCLAKLQQALDIPPEVLAALPSADQIQAKTAHALAGGGEDPS
ncbi:MAG TPA: ferredoxin family protein [Vicinamibacterales bacterium]|nr:ferredoxin family protein [Vicinamibacterales bacterium]